MSDPVTIESAVGTVPFGRPNERRTWYTQGRWWVCYRWDQGGDNDKVLIESSIDGSAWSYDSSGAVFWKGQGCTPSGSVILYTGSFGVALNESNGEIHCFFDSHLGSGYRAMIYRMGTCNGDGTITWKTSNAQNVPRYGSCYNNKHPKPVVDSNGYVWCIAETWYYNGPQHPVVYRNAANDGSWSDASGFPHALDSTADAYWATRLVALSGGRVLAYWGLLSSYAKCKLWNGSSWDSEETIAQDGSSEYATWACDAVKLPGSDSVLMTYIRSVGGLGGYDYRSKVRALDGALSSYALLFNEDSYSLAFTLCPHKGSVCCVRATSSTISAHSFNNATNNWSNETPLLSGETGLDVYGCNPALQDEGQIALSWHTSGYLVRFLFAEVWPDGFYVLVDWENDKVFDLEAP